MLTRTQRRAEWHVTGNEGQLFGGEIRLQRDKDRAAAKNGKDRDDAGQTARAV